MRYISVLLSMLLLLSALVLPIAGAETVEVFVTLAGEPLAEAAVGAGGAAAYAATAEGAAAIARAQDELAQAVEAIEAIPGATVLGRSWFLSRSVGVRLPAGQLEALAALDGVLRVERIATYEAADVDAEEPVQPESGVGQDAPVYAPDLLGVDALHAEGALGEGVVAAVIDTGFDLTHPVFSLPEGASPALTQAELVERLPLTSVGGRYPDEASVGGIWFSDKIPFAYDYVGHDTDVRTTSVHGTHVASILAGGTDAGGGDYVGVAPGAQLLLMKVFSDDSAPTSSDYAVYRAVEDAMLLGADIISLSLGSSAGYPYATTTFSLYRHLAQARELGCIVICAMGNDGAVGEGSVYDASHEIEFPLAANPDYGLVADPASYATTFAVGAYTPARVIESGLGSGDGELFAYTDSAAGQGFAEMDFVEVLAGQTLAYVAVPGYGRAEDYAGLSLSGKLALVRRGEITFTEKLLAAAQAGAVGMICYDNVADDESFGMAFTEMPIPAVSITQAEGERLLAAAPDEQTITVADDLLQATTPENAGQPADYSSRASGLIIRPSVSAPGTIYAAVPGGGYRSAQGTSMATPVVSGLTALALSRRERTDWDTAAMDSLLADLVTTAEPILDENGYPYAIRVQGGGAVRAERLLGVETALRAADGRGVIELGDELAPNGGFVLELTLTNRGSAAKTYAISASVGSDDYLLLEEADTTVAFATDHAHMFTQASLVLDGQNINRYGEAGTPRTVTLAPGQSTTLSIAVTLADSEAEEYSRYFVNGYYLEGYVWVEAEDGERLSLPYLGFAGDFDALPYLDAFGYDDGASFFPQNYLYGYVGETALNLGCSYYDENGSFRADLLAISPNGDGRLDEAYAKLYLLRNLHSMDAAVTDEAGTVVWETQRTYYLPKTYYDDGAEQMNVILGPAWDGTEDANADYVLPDGRYTLTFRIYDREDIVCETVELPIVVDTVAPVLTSTTIEEKDGSRYLLVTLQDDHYPMRAVLYRNATDAYGREETLYRDAHNISYRAGRRSITLRYDITDFAGDYLYLDLYDYAMNLQTHRIPLT